MGHFRVITAEYDTFCADTKRVIMSRIVLEQRHFVYKQLILRVI